MLKLCENGSIIDYLYETSSVLRKATETEISGLNFGFGSVRVFKNRNEIQFPHIPNLLNVACLCVCLGLNSAEMYDPRLNEWRYVTCMSTRRSSVGVGVVAGPSVRPSVCLSVCLKACVVVYFDRVKLESTKCEHMISHHCSTGDQK